MLQLLTTGCRRQRHKGRPGVRRAKNGFREGFFFTKCCTLFHRDKVLSFRTEGASAEKRRVLSAPAKRCNVQSKGCNSGLAFRAGSKRCKIICLAARQIQKRDESIRIWWNLADWTYRTLRGGIFATAEERKTFLGRSASQWETIVGGLTYQITAERKRLVDLSASQAMRAIRANRAWIQSPAAGFCFCSNGSARACICDERQILLKFKAVKPTYIWKHKFWILDGLSLRTQRTCVGRTSQRASAVSFDIDWHWSLSKYFAMLVAWK
jgi:hypothetical protein